MGAARDPFPVRRSAARGSICCRAPNKRNPIDCDPTSVCVFVCVRACASLFVRHINYGRRGRTDLGRRRPFGSEAAAAAPVRLITRRLSSPPLSSLYHIGSLRIACGLPLVARAPLCCSSRLWPKSDQSRHRCLRLIINSVCVSLSRSVPHCSAHNYATRRARLLSSEQASAQIGSHRQLVWYQTRPTDRAHRLSVST